MEEDGAGVLPRIIGPWFPVFHPNRFTRPLPPFNHDSGPVNVQPNLLPVQYFLQLLSTANSSLFPLLVTETNRYATQSNAQRWVPVNEDDMKAFIGLYLAMGIVRKPTIRSYWEHPVSNELFDTPCFREVMTRERFEKIMQYLHCNDNTTAQPTGTPAYDPLHRIKPVLDLVNVSFAENFRLDQQVAIDERIIGFKGRHKLKQYLSNKKRHRWGAKMWVLSDSNTGYTYQMYIYKGKHTTDDGTYENGQGYHVVTKLMQPHYHKNHHVTTDRFFSGPKLFHDLYQQGTYATGTTLINRKGIPEGLKRQSLAKNEISVRRQGPLIAMLWCDRKQVLILSTAGTTRMIMKRNSKGKIRIAPGLVHQYNKNMGGVDLGDQLIGTYDPDLRGRKLWRKILFNLIVTATVNAYILYRNSFMVQDKMNHLQFQQEICKGLIGDYRRKRNVPRREYPVALRRLNEGHFINYIAQNKRKICVGCNSKVRTWCCDCKVGLCIVCFRMFHTMAAFHRDE